MNTEDGGRPTAVVGENGVDRTGPVDVPLRVPWARVALFVAVSYGLAWLVSVPLWRGGGVADPNLLLVGGLIMFTPATAALLVTATDRRRRGAVRLGLWPPSRNLVWYLLAALVCGILFGLAALLLARALGFVRLAPDALSPSGLLALLPGMLLTTLLLCPLTFGEELGWRGWLLPTLRPLGTGPALVLSGVVWGPWHAPLILLGYNYQRPNLTGLLLMTVFCALLGIIIGWVRMQSASIWPAVLGHAAINASAGVWDMALNPDSASTDPLSGSVLGWPGWIVMAAVIVVGVVVARGWPRPRPRA